MAKINIQNGAWNGIRDNINANFTELYSNLDTGLKGDPGVDGKTILNGTSNPSSSIGVNGDFYINTTTSMIFGPKASGAWPAGKSLIGPKGDSGNGETGELSEDLNGERGSELIGRYGMSLSESLQSTSAAQGLKYFYTNFFNQRNKKNFYIDLVGTSISMGNSVGAQAAESFVEYYGKSKNRRKSFTDGYDGRQRGWKAQNYSGRNFLRNRGNVEDGAIRWELRVQCKTLVVFYSKELDGGIVNVTITHNGGVINDTLDCGGGTQIGLYKQWSIDPDFPATLALTPPTEGFGYIEDYIQDHEDFGITFSNTSWGGKGLWQLAGSRADLDVGTNDRAPQLPATGRGGLESVFAPDTPWKPDLIIYSGPTNDGFEFAVDLDRAVTLAVENGTSCLLIIEPKNAATEAQWANKRKPFYDVRDKFPDNVYVYDSDAFMSYDLSFNPRFHNSDFGDPHPGNYGYGDPHTAAAVDLCQKLGIPYWNRMSRRTDNVSLARKYSQADEPSGAAIGSVWSDISDPDVPILKKLVYKYNEEFNTRGLWECTDGNNTIVFDEWGFDPELYRDTIDKGVNFQGDECYMLINGGTDRGLDMSKYKPGATYTVSCIAENIRDFGNLSISLMFDGGGKWVQWLPTDQKFHVGDPGSFGNSMDLYFGNQTKIQRAIGTFKYPTTAEIAALQSQGLPMNNFKVAVSGREGTNFWAFRIEKGASACIATYNADGTVS